MPGSEIGLLDIYHKLGSFERAIEGLVTESHHAADKRADTYRSMEEMRGDIRDMKNKVDGLDNRVSKMEPSLADYHEKLQQVKGAGRLGRALWWVGGAIILPTAGALAHAWGWFSYFLQAKPPH